MRVPLAPSAAPPAGARTTITRGAQSAAPARLPVAFRAASRWCAAPHTCSRLQSLQDVRSDPRAAPHSPRPLLGLPHVEGGSKGASAAGGKGKGSGKRSRGDAAGDGGRGTGAGAAEDVGGAAKRRRSASTGVEPGTVHATAPPPCRPAEGGAAVLPDAPSAAPPGKPTLPPVRTSSEPVPNQFRTSSEPVPNHSRTSSEPVPNQFRTSSEPVPNWFPDQFPPPA